MVQLIYIVLILVIKELNMAICYFNRDYEKKYHCEYDHKCNVFEVNIDYDIMNELDVSKGIILCGEKTKFAHRDILIVDNNTSYLLKDASYFAQRTDFDGGVKTKFYASVVLKNKDYKKLSKLPDKPKIKKVKLYSKAINELIGYPSLSLTEEKEKHIIELYKNQEPQCVEINCNNISSVGVLDNWHYTINYKTNNMQIYFDGYIEIELYKEANYVDAFDYVYELQIFMQLYYKNKFLVDRILLTIDGEYYDCFLNVSKKIDYKENTASVTVNDSLLNFLKKCYTLIPYRKSKSEIRNIPYIIFKASRSIEDHFLTYYRFIECYYKRQQIKNIGNTFISYSIKKHYFEKHPMTDEEVEKYVQEIICLRNQYVHSGYFLKNSCLKVSFAKGNRRRNLKDYTVNNINFDWIYKRTDILYKITIDIIFTKLLGYDEYTYR